MSGVDIDCCVSCAVKAKIAALQQIPWFQQCRDSVVHKVAQRLQTRFAAPGEIVTRAGDESDRIFLLASGSILIWSGGQEPAELCDSGVIGDPRVLLRRAVDSQHNVVAKTSCHMHMLKAERFREAAGVKEDDGRDMSQLLESLKIPWEPLTKDGIAEYVNPKTTFRQSSFKRAATKALRVIQFVNALSCGGVGHHHFQRMFCNDHNGGFVLLCVSLALLINFQIPGHCRRARFLGPIEAIFHDSRLVTGTPQWRSKAMVDYSSWVRRMSKIMS